MYPRTWARENYNVTTYCDIAMKNYYNAKMCFEQLKDRTDQEYIWNESERFNQAVLITIVFSSMAIESFINDYLATCLGDENYYNNFDSLNVISKITMASKFIIGKDLEKNTELYYCLKELMKNRNTIVHSKSKTFNKGEYMQKIISEIKGGKKDFLTLEHEKDFKEAKNSIKAMVLLAEYFDKYDENIDAKFRFFAPQIHDEEYKKQVLKEFKIS